MTDKEYKLTYSFKKQLKEVIDGMEYRVPATRIGVESILSIYRNSIQEIIHHRLSELLFVVDYSSNHRGMTIKLVGPEDLLDLIIPEISVDVEIQNLYVEVLIDNEGS